MMLDENEKWMRRCLQLARNGWIHTAPNPMVGAVIVRDGRIIGEGFHRKSGEAHAEVNAINSVADKRLLQSATLYVSLEPCSHYGKTPPCADLIVRMGIPNVVVGTVDTFSKVQGRGIAKLRNAGINVTVGVLEAECRSLNRRFFTFNERHRPFITLKWAQSADGFIDRKRTSGTPIVFSTPRSAIDVHRLRASHQAIMVGRRTALLDNPRLSVRHWVDTKPLRIVIDSKGQLPANLHLFDGTQPTLVVCDSRSRRANLKAEFFCPDFSQPILPQLLDELCRRQVQSLLVEGGRQLLQSFIDGNLWDEAVVELSTIRLGGGVPAPTLPAHKPASHKHSWGVEHLIVENK